jgi:thioredoxin reductase (NADPH)
LADFDLIVAGGGLAGLTAGLFAARRGLSTLVLEPLVPGGHLVNVERIEDFPGFLDGVAGYDLCPTVQEQAMNAGAEFRMAALERLTFQEPEWVVETADGEELRASAVIVATGAHPRALGVAGEEALQGRGISHCATCDGPLFRGKTVGVVGAGDSGLQEALTLAGFAGQVIVFERAADSPAQQVLRGRVEETANVELQLCVEVVGLTGDGGLSGVRVRSAGAESDVPLDGLFVYVGLDPTTAFLSEAVELDGGGHVPTDALLRTSRPGLFAAGDARQGAPGHAIAAAGDGATAAASAYRYLRGLTG